MTDAKRQKLINTVRALLETKGCTEAEAMARLAKAAAMMAQHNITDADVESVRNKSNYDFRPCFYPREGKRYNIVYFVAEHIAALCSCRYFVERASNGLVYFGDAVDTEIAVYMTALVRNTMDASWNTWITSPEGMEQNATVHKRTLRTSFNMAFIERVSVRIQEMTRAKGVVETGNALVVLKGQIVDEIYQSVKPETHVKTSTIGTRRGNHQASLAGHEAGDRVNLDARGIE